MPRTALFLASALLMVGCGSAHPPPEGYAASCYGGDFKKYHDGNIPRVSIRIAISESEWPDLAESLRQFASHQDLDFFDTTLNLNHVHALGLSVCSPEGVFIDAHEQIWKSNPQSDHDPNHTTISLYSFKRLDTTAVEESLVSHLKGRYPDAEVKRVDAIRAPDKSPESTHGK